MIRLVSDASVEESIWRSAEDKLRLENDVVELNVTESLSSVTSGGKRSAPNGALSPSVTDGDDDSLAEFQPALTSTSTGKRILQGEIIKFLSDALTLEGEWLGSPRCN